MVPNVTKVRTSCGEIFHRQSIKGIATNRFPGLRSFGHPPTPDLHCMKESRGGGRGGGGGTGAALPSSVVGSIIRSWDSAASTLEHNAMEVNPGISVQEHNYTYMFNFEQVTFSITCFLWLLSVHQSGGFINFE